MSFETLAPIHEATHRPEHGLELHEMIEVATASLTRELNERAKALRVKKEFAIEKPTTPDHVTKEHIEISRAMFHDGLHGIVLPKATELDPRDANVMKVLYPSSQQKIDRDRGLTSYKSEEWSESAGEQYKTALADELAWHGGAFTMVETIQKPHGGNYGTAEGDERGVDPLQSLLTHAFGEGATRFNHSVAELNQKLIPLVRQALEKEWRGQGLVPPEGYEVVLCPASLWNLTATLIRPELSTTASMELTSTQLTDARGIPTEKVIALGDVDSGGAAGFHSIGEQERYTHVGFRLAIMFKHRVKN